MTTAPTAEPKPGRKLGVFAWLFLLLIVVIAALVIAAVVRGEWVEHSERNPSSPEEGTVTQLFQKPNGNVVVRCAVLVDAPPKNVWSAVSSYAKHSEFLPDVRKLEAKPQKDGRLLVAGVIHLPIGGDWSFQSLTKHTETPEKGEYSATWTERNVDAFKLNRGSWSVSPADKAQRQTLLVCTLQIELKECPNFVVRDLLLYRLPAAVTAMRDESLRRKHG